MPSTNAPTEIFDGERVACHLDFLRTVALAICDSRDDAEDLVQDTVVNVLHRPRVVRGDERAYLRRALHNTHVSRHRRRRARPSTVPLPDRLDAFAPRGTTVPGPEGAVFAREALAAIAALPEHLRTALVAVQIAGFTGRETARGLGIREGTVMTRCFRARRKLAPLLS